MSTEEEQGETEHVREREAFAKQVREQSFGEVREMEVREGNRQKEKKQAENQGEKAL